MAVEVSFLIGAKTDVIKFIVFLVCQLGAVSTRACVERSGLGAVNYGNRKVRKSVCGGTVDVWSVIPNAP